MANGARRPDDFPGADVDVAHSGGRLPMCIDCGKRPAVYPTLGVCKRCYHARRQGGDTGQPAQCYGACACGCGEPIYDRRRAWIAGHRKAIAHCRCGCGAPVPDHCIFVEGHQNHLWRGRSRHKHTEETRRLLSEQRKAEWRVPANRDRILRGRRERVVRAHPRTSDLLAALRRTDGYKAWRWRVFERDDFTCQCCGQRPHAGHALRLEAHHITPFVERLDLALCVSNGITLCHACHRETSSYARKGRGGSVQLPFSFAFDGPF